MKVRNSMRARFDELLSAVEIEYKEVPFKDEYKIDVIEIDAEVSIESGFEIDCYISIQVAVESDKGVVILEGDQWFTNLAETHDSKYNHFQMDDLSVKESRIDDADLEQFLRDIADSIVEINFSAQ